MLRHSSLTPPVPPQAAASRCNNPVIIPKVSNCWRSRRSWPNRTAAPVSSKSSRPVTRRFRQRSSSVPVSALPRRPAMVVCRRLALARRGLPRLCHAIGRAQAWAAASFSSWPFLSLLLGLPGGRPRPRFGSVAGRLADIPDPFSAGATAVEGTAPPGAASPAAERSLCLLERVQPDEQSEHRAGERVDGAAAVAWQIFKLAGGAGDI